MSTDEERLEAERGRLNQELSQTGLFRRGSLNATYRRCGKPNYACAKPDHPGHGPRYLLTTKVNGKTCAKEIRSGPVLEKVKQEVANHQKFRELIKDIIAVNEQICEIKDAQLQADAEATAKKGASKRGSKRKSKPS